MRKSKRQHQTDLLTKLLDRVSQNEIEVMDTEVWNDNISWIQIKMSEVIGGDIDLDSGGLTSEDMLKANNMWTRYSQQPATNEMPA